MRTGAPYPYATLQRCWHTVLLHQFHDILPGTSIGWVLRQAEQEYARVAAELELVISDALAALTGPGGRELDCNAGPYPVDGAPALGAWPAEPPGTAPTAVPGADGIVLANEEIRVVVDRRGLVTSIRDLEHGRELVTADAPANLLQLFRDTPTQWDAWDLDEHYRRTGRDLVELDALSDRTRPDGAGRPVRRLVDHHPAAVAAPRRPGAGHRHRGGLGGAAEAAQAGLPGGRARRPGQLGDPVRPPAPADPRQHLLGRGPVRDLRAPLGARRRAGIRRRGGQRRHLRPRHRPQHPARRGDHDHGAAVPAARPAVPRSRRPTRDGTGSRWRCGSARRVGDAVAEGYRLNLPLRRVSGARRHRRRCWPCPTRRSWSRR